MLACERAGDSERPQQWSTVLDDFVRAHDHVTLLAFCRTCCADVYAANGRIDSAEAELELAVRELTARASARAASLRRPGWRRSACSRAGFDEAEQLLERPRGGARGRCRPVLRCASRAVSRGAASALLTRPARRARAGRTCSPRRCSRSSSRRGWSRADLDGATAAASALDGDRRGPRARARRGARDSGSWSHRASPRGARRRRDLLLEAVNRFAALGARLDAARTRLELARALAVHLAGDRGRHGTTRAHRARSARRASRRRRGGRADALAGREGPSRAAERQGS